MTKDRGCAIAFFVVAATLIIEPSFSRARPSVNWEGPSCQYGDVKYKVCSTEQSVPGIFGGNVIPCYVSKSASYSPNPVELALIGVCQRAKAALNAQPPQREDALSAVAKAALDLKDTVQDYPDFAENNEDVIRSIAKDIGRFGERVMVYGNDGSRDNWDDVAEILGNIWADAAVDSGLGLNWRDEQK